MCFKAFMRYFIFLFIFAFEIKAANYALIY